MVRTKRMNRLVWLAVLLLLLLSGCAEKETTDSTSFDGHCTLSISCETALQNSDRLDPANWKSSRQTAGFSRKRKSLFRRERACLTS